MRSDTGVTNLVAIATALVLLGTAVTARAQVSGTLSTQMLTMTAQAARDFSSFRGEGC